MSDQTAPCTHRVDFSLHTELVFARPTSSGATDRPLLTEACRHLAALTVEAKVSCVVVRAVPGADFWPTADELPPAEKMIEMVESSSIPFVGAVQGACFGIGLRLMLACDVNVVGDSVRIAAAPDVDPAVASVLAQRIGRTRANWMVMAGAELNSQDAENSGLATIRGSDADFELAIRRAVDHVHAFGESGRSVARHFGWPDGRA